MKKSRKTLTASAWKGETMLRGQWRSQGGGHQGHGPPQRQIRGGHHIIWPPPNNRWAPMAVWGPGPYSIVTRLEKPTPAINSSHTSLWGSYTDLWGPFSGGQASTLTAEDPHWPLRALHWPLRAPKPASGAQPASESLTPASGGLISVSRVPKTRL